MQPLQSESSERTNRVLAPVKRVSDVEAVLAYARLRAPRAGIDTLHLAFLHVEPSARALAGPACPGYAEELLGYAERRCRAGALAHESHIRAGELVFSILDAAELLACEAIVMPSVKQRRWHHFFPAKIVRQVERLSRAVPLIVIDADGIVIRNKRL